MTARLAADGPTLMSHFTATPVTKRRLPMISQVGRHIQLSSAPAYN